VSSWALVDSDSQPKAAYYYAKRFFAPVLVTARWMEEELVFYGINQQNENWAGTLEIHRFHSSDNKPSFSKEIVLNLESGEVKTLLAVNAEEKSVKGDSYLWTYRLRNEEGSEVMRCFTAREPLKQIFLPPRKISMQLVEQNDTRLRLRIASGTLALAVQLSHPVLEFSSNWFDLWPEEQQEILAVKREAIWIRADMIRVRCLNDFLFPR
jgi:beta-mannosidase